MRARRLLPLLLVAATVLPATGMAARKPKPAPCTGTYMISGEALVGGAAPDALVIGTSIATLSGCPPVAVKLKATKKATSVKAKWPSCPGLRGVAAFAGKIATGCATLTGTFKVKKEKIRRRLSATRSSCGDGLLDPSREGCDGPSGCAVGQLCQTSCACSGTPGGGCGPNAPQAQFTPGGTLVAGQPVTFDGRASSDADGDALIWSWSFGDGGRGGGAQIAHVYPEAGQYAARLTVSDGCGHSVTKDETITIAAGPAPTGMTTARGRVLTVSGVGLAGAEVRAEPGGTAVSDGAGDVEVTVGQGVPVRITVGKDGYAEQVIRTEVPNLPQPDAYFEATLLQREPAQTLADAAAGGEVAGKDGARVALPANALVDADGDAVGGPVDVFVTPVDVVNDIEAFPGRAIGLSPDGSQGPIVTYGTVEYVFQQNGETMNLAPGALATIEIPIYATKNLDGSLLEVGHTFPLWALDPRTAQWVEEGQGTVVASATSPSGFALRGQVAHFSFWNHDRNEPPYFPKPKCLVDTNADGILEDLTGTGHCWHAGTGPEQPNNGFGVAQRAASPNAVVAPSFPNWLGQEVLPAAGGKVLPVPADMDIVLHSRAQGGLLQGSKAIRGPANLEEEVVVVLEPVNATGDHITIPFQTVRTISQSDSLHVYDFDGTAGQTVFVTVEEPTQSITAADITILLPDDGELGPVQYRPLVDRPGRIGLVLPESGNYRIVVNLFPGASQGLYRILVDYMAAFPIVVATTPASNATGVATSAVPAATFSRVVSEFLSFDLYQADLPVDGTTDVTGAMATFTPDAPLIPGASYRAVVDGFRAPGDVQPTGFPRNYTWHFNVAETPGTLVPIGLRSENFPQVAADAAGNVYAVWARNVPNTSNHQTWASQYTPGVGWSPATNFFDGAKIGGSWGVSVAVMPGGAIALWPDPSSGTEVSVYESRYTPATGWSSPTVIENVTTQFTQVPNVGADAAGNVIALFGTTAPAGSGDVYWSRSPAGGAWTAPAILFDDSRKPGLAVGASGHAVAWAEQLATGFALVRRYVPGQGWGAIETFEVMEAVHASLDAAGNAFLLVVTDNIQHLVRRYDLDAQAWSAPQNVQGSAQCRPDARILAAPDGHAVVVGCTSVAPGPGVFAVHYTPDDQEGAWGSAVLLASPAPTMPRPHAGIDASGNVVAAWIEATNGTTGYYKRYTAGVGWEAMAHEFPGIGGSLVSSLAVGGNGTAVMVMGGPFQAAVAGVRLP